MALLISNYTCTSGAVIPSAYVRIEQAVVTNSINPNIDGTTGPVVTIKVSAYASQAARQSKLPIVDSVTLSVADTIAVSGTSATNALYTYLKSVAPFSTGTDA